MSIEYLKRILNARVYEVAEETPLDPAPALSARLGNRVLLKREDMQPVFSFKLRGAYNKMANLSAEERARGVICASAGNHAQGVALSARKLGCRAVIVMPVTTPTLKVDAVRARGGEVVLQGDSFSDAYQHALKLQAEQGLTFVHPFDDPDVIAGQGTIGLEIVQQDAELAAALAALPERAIVLRQPAPPSAAMGSATPSAASPQSSSEGTADTDRFVCANVFYSRPHGGLSRTIDVVDLAAW